MDNLSIDVIQEFGMYSYIIQNCYKVYKYGTFITVDVRSLLPSLKYKDFTHYTIPEIIDACKFLSADEKEYYKLKYG